MQTSPLYHADVKAVARLHKSELPTAFLSGLGIGFLEVLYDGLSKSSYGLTYVCKEKSEVIGFICGTTSTQKMYRDIFHKKWACLFLQVAICVLKKPRLIRSIPAYLLYPNKEGDCAELLAIAVKKKYRRRQVGKMLTWKLLDELRKRGRKTVKVIAEHNNFVAHKFYSKLGFRYRGSFYLSSAHMNSYEYVLSNRKKTSQNKIVGAYV